MNDLVKRARKGRSANEFPSEELVHEMAYEIERLEGFVRLYKAYRVGCQQAVLDDMREWADSGLDAWRPNIAHRVIDAYEKDMK